VKGRSGSFGGCDGGWARGSTVLLDVSMAPQPFILGTVQHRGLRLPRRIDRIDAKWRARAADAGSAA
jgi:hypothetical protein